MRPAMKMTCFEKNTKKCQFKSNVKTIHKSKPVFHLHQLEPQGRVSLRRPEQQSSPRRPEPESSPRRPELESLPRRSEPESSVRRSELELARRPEPESERDLALRAGVTFNRSTREFVTEAKEGGHGVRLSLLVKHTAAALSQLCENYQCLLFGGCLFNMSGAAPAEH